MFVIIIRNVSIDLYRSRKKETNVSLEDISDGISELVDNIDEMLIIQETFTLFSMTICAASDSGGMECIMKFLQKKMAVGVTIAAILLIGSIAVYASTSSDTQASKSATETKVESNKVLRGAWNLTVTEIAFYPGSTIPDQKGASVTLKMDNVNGPAEAFLPTGIITALVGESGKTYELDADHPLDKLYTSSQDAIKMEAKEKGLNYEPGVFQIKPHFMVDRSEKNFSKIVYQDENGKKVEVPIEGITPIDVQPNPESK